MKLIPMRTKLDLAILPIGDNFTMDIEDAIVASDFIECDKVLGYHYDTLVILKLIIKQPFKSFPIKEKI
jgi:L-ascorbate metabolism protein UlaG (beta-lactamase superfamily)